MEVRPNETVDNSTQYRRHVPATPSKQPVVPPNTVETTSVSQRLQKELMSLMMIGGDLGVSAFPEGESIFAWIGTIAGGEGTAYEGLSYKLSLRFPLDYPFKPPQIKFETMCFHPNVDQFGNICLDILQVSIIVLVELKGCRRCRCQNDIEIRISGLQLMIAEPFFYPSKVSWENPTRIVP